MQSSLSAEPSTWFCREAKLKKSVCRLNRQPGSAAKLAETIRSLRSFRDCMSCLITWSRRRTVDLVVCQHPFRSTSVQTHVSEPFFSRTAGSWISSNAVLGQEAQRVSSFQGFPTRSILVGGFIFICRLRALISEWGVFNH